MAYEYSEDNLIEQTAIDLFYHQLGWDTQVAFNKESYGEGSTLGRLNKKEVVLKRNFLEKIKEFNPNIQVVILSAQDKIEVAIDCMHHAAFDYVVKSETAFIRLQKIINSITEINKLQKQIDWYMDRM